MTLHVCLARSILGDPGAASWDDRMFVVKVFCKIDLTVNFLHKHSIVPTNCAWVSEDSLGVVCVKGFQTGKRKRARGGGGGCKKAEEDTVKVPFTCRVPNFPSDNVTFFDHSRFHLRIRKLELRSRPVLPEHQLVEPRFNEPLYNEVCGITNNFLYPGSDNKMFEKEPRYNKTSLQRTNFGSNSLLALRYIEVPL